MNNCRYTRGDWLHQLGVVVVVGSGVDDCVVAIGADV